MIHPKKRKKRRRVRVRKKRNSFFAPQNSGATRQIVCNFEPCAGVCRALFSRAVVGRPLRWPPWAWRPALAVEFALTTSRRADKRQPYSDRFRIEA
jgi:hypothetical protein